MADFSRRKFVALTMGGAAAAPFVFSHTSARAAAPVTAQEIADRIKKSVGVEWSSDDVDTFKAGDPSMVVTSVVTTSMATLDVLQKAVQAGANFVITAAPTFYTKADLSMPAARGLGAGAADGRGQLAALHYEVPMITLGALASQLKKTLGTRGGIRAIGDPSTTVRRIGLLPGYTLVQASIAMMPTVDVIIAGEVQEWESATYAQDVVFAGIKKGFISIGRVVNEAPGMQVCAEWLKTIVPELPVRFISAGDPYWRPL
jgi:putative NIF3 family GTP cyclohydrolase 1 type 2